MNYGMYLAASGVLTNLYRQDVIANNLANVNTPGFKPDSVYQQARLPERLEDPVAGADPQRLLEQLGGGTLSHPTYTNQNQGALERSANPLDLAIQGDGFFMLEGESGNPADGFRLTRDGRFTLNTNGELVHATSGRRVLDDNGQPITLDPAQPVHVDADGHVLQGGAVVARLNLVMADDPADLTKAGGSLFQVRGDNPELLEPATGSVQQGFVESSAVDAIMTLNELMGATKSAQGSAQLMQYHDHILGQAIGTFGRVA